MKSVIVIMYYQTLENRMQQVEILCGKVASLGKGYNECIYQEAICVELRKHNILYSKEQVIPVVYDGNMVLGNVRMDIVLPFDRIIIEDKAIESELKDSHFPQIITYLKTTGYSYGLIVNFIQNPSKPLLEMYTVHENNNQFCSSSSSSYSGGS